MTNDKNTCSAGDHPTIEFCGIYSPVDHHPFTIGRDADLELDDGNRFLHRQFLTLSFDRGMWFLSNVGDQLTATVSDGEGRLEAFLAPGAVLPLVVDRTVVRFSAGPTSYEFTISIPEPQFSVNQIGENDSGETTVGRVALTPDHLALILALAEPALRGSGRAGAAMPSSGAAAQRLGWTVTKFNRKLDNVCRKLTDNGVRGLHGKPGQLASNRRARLVEYALAVRLITRDDLPLLDAYGTNGDST